MERTKLTAAQAVVKFLDAQYVEHEGEQTKFIEGVFAIFGHGCCVGMGEALSHYAEKKKSDDNFSHQLKVYQGHNEQGMGHAAIAYAKQNKRKKIIPCLSSIGPGATNMVTSAALATVNRIPALFLPGDTFASRQPDPVLQQIEQFNSPLTTVNDAFAPVCVFFDRVSRPEQVISAMLGAMRFLTSSSQCGAVCVSLCQDVQGEAYDYPLSFFQKRVHVLKRVAPSEDEIAKAVETLKKAKRPMVIVGGGARYSEAGLALDAFCTTYHIPFAETQAGRGVLLGNHSLNLGGIGVTGGLAANKIAQRADVVVAVGTRLGDFTTASKSAFVNEEVQLIAINTAEHDCGKLEAIPMVCDARLALEALLIALQKSDFKVQQKYANEVAAEISSWRMEVSRLGGNKEVAATHEKQFGTLSQVHAVGLLNTLLPSNAIVVSAAGSLPGDMQRMWNVREPDTYHMEYGYSCMGYEVSGALGVKMAEPESEVFVLVGDGSYVMMHSELLTSLQEGLKINIMLFDNSGFHCIDNLQNSQGFESFGCKFKYRDASGRLEGKNIPINFAMNASSYGCETFTVTTYAELQAVIPKVLAAKVSTLVDIKVGEKTMTGGYESWWRVGTPAVSPLHGVNKEYEALKKRIPTLRDY